MEPLPNNDAKGVSRFNRRNVCIIIHCTVIASIVISLVVTLATTKKNYEVEQNEELDDIDELVVQTLNLHKTKRSALEKVKDVGLKLTSHTGWTISKSDAKSIFDAYYKCVKKKTEELKSAPVIKALLVLEGQRVEMKCPVCLRPDHDSSKLSIEWQKVRPSDAEMLYVEGDRFEVNDQMSLIIEDVDVDDAGQYFCVRTMDQDFEEVYQLDVLFRERRRHLDESEKDNLLPPFDLTKNNIRTFTLWGKWSDCDQCGKVGRRRKVGVCMVSKIDKSKPVMPRDLPIMELYPKGLPCRSTIIPEYLAKIKRIKNRKSETIFGKCFLPCPTVPPFVVITDSSGKAVEVVEAGYYSLKYL